MHPGTGQAEAGPGWSRGQIPGARRLETPFDSVTVNSPGVIWSTNRVGYTRHRSQISMSRKTSLKHLRAPWPPGCLALAASNSCFHCRARASGPPTLRTIASQRVIAACGLHLVLPTCRKKDAISLSRRDRRYSLMYAA